MAREATNRLLEMIEEGILDRDTVIMACVKYMSEDDVADMCHINDFFYDEGPRRAALTLTRPNPGRRLG